MRRTLSVLVLLYCFPSASAGEWTGRGWQGSSSGSSWELWGPILVVGVSLVIICLVHEEWPSFFPAILGLTILFIASGFIAEFLSDNSSINYSLGLAVSVFALLLAVIAVWSWRDKIAKKREEKERQLKEEKERQLKEEKERQLKEEITPASNVCIVSEDGTRIMVSRSVLAKIRGVVPE